MLNGQPMCFRTCVVPWPFQWMVRGRLTYGLDFEVFPSHASNTVDRIWKWPWRCVLPKLIGGVSIQRRNKYLSQRHEREGTMKTKGRTNAMKWRWIKNIEEKSKHMIATAKYKCSDDDDGLKRKTNDKVTMKTTWPRRNWWWRRHNNVQTRSDDTNRHERL